MNRHSSGRGRRGLRLLIGTLVLFTVAGALASSALARDGRPQDVPALTATARPPEPPDWLPGTKTIKTPAGDTIRITQSRDGRVILRGVGPGAGIGPIVVSGDSVVISQKGKLAKLWDKISSPLKKLWGVVSGGSGGGKSCSMKQNTHVKVNKDGSAEMTMQQECVAQ